MAGNAAGGEGEAGERASAAADGSRGLAEQTSALASCREREAVVATMVLGEKALVKLLD